MATSAGVGARRLAALTAAVVTSVGQTAPAARADGGGSWAPLAAMSTPRISAAAAPLADGRVLVAGGEEGVTTLSSTELYDPARNTWVAGSPMSQARWNAVAAALPGNRVLVAGGDGPSQTLASAEIYNALTDTWIPAAPMPAARTYAAAAPLPNGRVLVVGGQSGNSGQWTALIYDSLTNSWLAAPPPLHYTYQASATALPDGRVLVVGGNAIRPGPGAPPADSNAGAELFDPRSNSWSTVADLHNGRTEAVAASLADGRVLVTGGGPGANATSEIFEPTANDWFPAAPTLVGRGGAVAARLPDGRVLVAGGAGELHGYEPLSSAEAFTPPSPERITNLGVPQLQGDPIIGHTLSLSAGAWNATAASVVDQWQRCNRTCVNVGAPEAAPQQPQTPSYTVTHADLAARIRVIETAHDAQSSVASASAMTGPVSPPGIHLEWSVPTAFGPPPSKFPLATVRVVDDLGRRPASVRYRIWQALPSRHPLFAAMTGVLRFERGQSTMSVQVPTLDAGVSVLTPALDVALTGATGAPLATPSTGSIAISDPADFVRVPGDPLGTTPAPSRANPLGSARFYDDSAHSAAAHWAASMSATDASAAEALMTIADQPNTARFGPWNGPYPGSAVASYLKRAAGEQPGAVPMLSTYYLVNGHCGHWADPPATQAAYHTWIKSLAQGIGTRPAVLFLEMDSLITVGCLNKQGLAIRMRELRDAINVLSNVPHLVTYLDAGAADALRAWKTARLLKRAGVRAIQGFFLNSTHFDWTSNEIRYGEAVSRMTGGKHFVVNTAENGRGPLVPRNRVKHGNEVLCDPAGRGLGPLPTWNTGFRNVDAFAWIANPGVSGGRCRPGAPPTGVFWPQLAIELVRNADYRVR